MELNEAKGKTWKFGKKHGIRGTVAAALKHHPDKFSTDPDSGKMNPYAIFTAKEKKTKGGIESHYQDQPTTSKKAPKKKKEFKDEDKKDEGLSLWQQWKLMREQQLPSPLPPKKGLYRVPGPPPARRKQMQPTNDRQTQQLPSPPPPRR